MTPNRSSDRGRVWSGVAVAVVTELMVAITIAAGATTGQLGALYGPSIVTGFSLAALGGFIVSRRPRHRIGWIMLFVGFTQGLEEVAGAYGHGAILPGSSLPAMDVAAWLAKWMWVPGLGVLVTFGFLLFPDGHLPSRRWRWVGWVAGVALTAGVGTVAIGSWQYRHDFTKASSGPPPGPVAAVFVAMLGILSACMIASLVSLAIRYRRAGTDERHQLRWIAYAGVLLVVAAAIDWAPVPLWVTNTAIIPLVVAFPAAIAIAILRYRLYDIDVVISRTLVYGSLAAFITAVYVGIVVGVGTLVGSGGKPNLVLSIVATAIVAVAFQPVQERLQRIANRLVYGKRATPYEVLSQFSERVAETYAADEALPRMARVLAEGTGAESAEVWLRAGDTMRRAAAWPDDVELSGPASVADGSMPNIPGVDRVVEVRHQGDLLGALAVTKRSGESLTPVEEKLLEDLAAQAGLVLKNVGLTAELLQRLEELRASRQRLVAAQDEARRRLERNLHDGAQQNLVALKVKLGLAESFADKDPARARQLLGEIKSDADEALETLRDLARGIYPPLLADKGLAVALESQARKATLPVRVDADGVSRYPQDIEAAVYFCCLEGLQNVQKYARATRATIRLGERDGMLVFEVEDDGRGFDPDATPRGSGLTNMSDRLDALGGSVVVESQPGKGTQLVGTMPIMAGALT
jgi:signal transduction histidine kinase